MVETNREKFLKKHNLPKSESLSIKEISELSGMPIGALNKVRDRGYGAYGSSPESVRLKSNFSKNANLSSFPMTARLSKEQWAFGRIYAFVTKTKKVYYGADNDIREEYGLK